MSTPASGKKATSIGHSSRAVLTPLRRNEIWDHVYRVAIQPKNAGQWFTKQELVKLAMDQTSLRCTAHELTEVMRGKKNKGALGMESKKGKSEHLYRFVTPGAAKVLVTGSPEPAPSEGQVEKESTHPPKKPPATKGRPPFTTPTRSKEAPAKPSSTSVSKKKTAAAKSRTDATRAESRGDATLAKPEGDATPVESKSNATSSNPKASTTPAKSKVNATPAKPKARATPSELEARATPAKSKARATPAKAKASATPAKSKVRATPSEPEASATPAKPKASATPVQSKANATPAKSRAKATPAKSRVNMTLTESKASSSPRKSGAEVSTPPTALKKTRTRQPKPQGRPGGASADTAMLVTCSRVGPKSPSPNASTDAARRSSSRKRRLHAEQSQEERVRTPARPAMAKKPRLPEEAKTVTFREDMDYDPDEVPEEEMGRGEGRGRLGGILLEAPGRTEDRRRSWCTIS